MNAQKNSSKKSRLLSLNIVRVGIASLVAAVLVATALILAMQAHPNVSMAAAATVGSPTTTTTSATAGTTPTQAPTTTPNQPALTATQAPTSTPKSGTASPVESQICTPTDAHAVNLAAHNGGAPVLYYLSGQGGYQVSVTNTTITAYNPQTHTKQVLDRSNQGSNIMSMTVAPNKHWVLVDVRLGLDTVGERLELMSADGTQRIVLEESCNSAISNMTNFAWSPDSTHIAYANTDGSGIIVLNLTTGIFESYVSNYQSNGVVLSLSGWVDANHLIVRTTDATNTYLDVADLRKGSHQGLRNLNRFATFATACGNVAMNNGVVYVATCDGSQGGSQCQGNVVQGPSVITAYNIADGTQRIVYRSASNAIIALAVSGMKLNFWVLNETGDASQSGLWSVNVSGTHATHLTTTSVAACLYATSGTPEWQITSNGQYVASVATLPNAHQVLTVSDANGHHQVIVSQAQIGMTGNVFAIAFGAM